jgi:hypothetical protein
MGKPIIWSGANAKLINSGDLVDKYDNSLTDGGKVTYAWPSHGLTAPNDIGRPIRVVSGNQLALADNTTAANAEVAGFIYDIIDIDTVRVSFGGNCPAVGSNVLEFGGSVGGGNVYFLASTAGKVTATEPTTIGYISKPIAIGTATGSMFFINYRGSTVGSTNARTQINLSNNSTTNMQNCASYDAGSIEGWIYIDATTDYRFYFNAPFAEKGTNNDYFISPSYVGDTPPAGFSITINSSGQSIITLPNISGFVSATCTYSLNAPAVGTNFPLAIDGSNVTNGTPVVLGLKASTSAGLNFASSTGSVNSVLNDSGYFGINTTTFTSRGKFNVNHNSATLSTATNVSGAVGQFMTFSAQIANVNNSTVDLLRFLDPSGTILGSYGLSGVFNLYCTGASGVNAASAAYNIYTTGNGTASAILQSIGTAQIRGTSPVSSVQIANDSAGGQVKITITFINNSGVVTGGYAYASFSGLFVG